MFRFHTALLALLLFPIMTGLGQIADNESETLTVEATILDEKSLETIPYAAIVNQTTGNGTISDMNGYFSMKGLLGSDTLIISFVGYEQTSITADQAKLRKSIYLAPKAELLNEVTILADNAILYALVSGCRRSQTNIQKVAKTYYMLETMVDTQQVELVECYYNGTYSGYDTRQLDLKNGRLALSDFNRRFFVSTESSKALLLHPLFDNSTFFPASPLQLNKRQLRKEYDLSLISRYQDGTSGIVYVIDFIPRNAPERYFKGRVWIDSLQQRVIKVNLTIDSAGIHPFVPHGHASNLTRVALDITKTFLTLEGRQYVHSVDFNYQISYRTKDSSSYTVNTNSVLYAFDYQDLFLLPRFDFSTGSYEDYRKINASPYNAFFWENIDEFSMESVHEKNRQFIEDSSTITNQTLFQRNAFFEKGILQHRYIFWNDKRIQFRETAVDTTVQDPASVGFLSDQYHLEAQIYLDVNEFKDSVSFITRTIFDPYKSYYRLPTSNQSLAFINMYFDLVEINRRELEKDLLKANNTDKMFSIYDQRMVLLKNTVQQFYQDVEHGDNQSGMMKWNTYISDQLGIDNLNLFKDL